MDNTEEALASGLLGANIPPKMQKMAYKLPVVFDWVEYKGETVFASFNYDRSEKARKPMMDICYCATRALNDVVLFTAQWDKSKFKLSKLSLTWGK